MTKVNVAAPDIAAALPLQIAVSKGYFKQQGLQVTIEKVASSNITTSPLLAHTLDFVDENYVGMYVQEENAPALGLKVIADNFQGAPDIAAVVVPKGSKITSPAQLAGKKVALSSLGTSIGALSVDALLSGYQVKAGDYHIVPMAFNNMPAALDRNEVDAAWVTEPFVTVSEMAGARVLAYTYTGALSDFPVACWATTAWFAQHYPKTTAAFARAINEAQQAAAGDATLVRTEEPIWIPTLSPKIANVMAQGTYNTTLSLTRLQRVADVMEEFGELPKNYNVAPMLQLPTGA